eukprot:Nk52_evm6s353 gene=Nk52_evmTU6s353
MSFIKYNQVICEGDLVVFYVGFDTMTYEVMKKGGIHQNKRGAFSHDKMIGKEYGTVVWNNKNSAFIHMLHPSPELWTVVLPHRTQILYLADVSLVATYLDLRPGATVVESGTGSGSLSHSLIRTILPDGFLHTFEFHQKRSERAAQEFREHGLGDNVKVYHRNVCRDGFGLKDTADAVFLDLPAPWEAVVSAKESLKKNGKSRFCSFSPCIEQIQRTADSLRELQFTNIECFEVIAKPYDIKQITLKRPKNPGSLKRKLSDMVASENNNNSNNAGNGDKAYSTSAVATSNKKKATKTREKESKNTNEEVMTVSRPFEEMRGHTGYLIFAQVPPLKLPVQK